MEGNQVIAMFLLLALSLTGFLLTTNLVDKMLMDSIGVSLGLGFDNITGGSSGFWIIMLRLIIAPIMTILPIYVIYKMFTQGY